ncbi:unnamed protein product [Schistocephalus solidus]|uniref:Uncharacterized protein n=1 Tax=Schistocephalus solidus TaxID=70667 RepID=A0A3P7D8X0_SCHSO|nr:unnamed protein product [Schistocephalus solidus]
MLKRLDRNHYWALNRQTNYTGRVPADVLDIIVPLPDPELAKEPTSPPTSPTAEPPNPVRQPAVPNTLPSEQTWREPLLPRFSPLPKTLTVANTPETVSIDELTEKLVCLNFLWLFW